MKHLRHFALVLIAFFMVGSSAQADTIHTSFGFTLGSGSFYGGSGPFAECQGYSSSCTKSDSQSATGTYNLFDSSLGTLNSVTITLTSTFPLGTELLSFGGHSTLSGSSSYNIGDIFTGTVNAQTYTCDGFCDTYPQPNGTVSNPLNDSYFVPVASLGSYIGTGTSNMNVFQSVTLNGSSEDGYTFRVRTNAFGTVGWNGNVDIAYDYTPAAPAVPEPTSASLLLTGLSSVAFAIRKLRK